MSRRQYPYNEGMESEPLDNPYTRSPRTPHHQQQSRDQYTWQSQQQQQQQQQQPQQQPQPYLDRSPYQASPAYAPNNGRMPGTHPDSTFSRLRADRRRSRDMLPPTEDGSVPYLAPSAATNNHRQFDPVSPVSPPYPPPHRAPDARAWGRENSYPPQAQQPRPQSNITPGADNFSEAAAGGMAGIAYTVAERNVRESGLEAVRGPDYPRQAYQQQGQWDNQGQSYGQHGVHGVESQSRPAYGGNYSPAADRDSHSSLQGLGVSAVTPGNATPGVRTPSRSPHSFNNELYTDDPYQSYSRPQDPHLGVVNPHEIEDDGDDGLDFGRKGPRTSMLSLGGSSHRGRDGSATGAAAASGAGVAAGSVIGALGGMVGRNAASGRNGRSGGQYGPVHNNKSAYQGGGGDGGVYDLGGPEDKSEWLSKQKGSSKKWKWAIFTGVALVIVAAVVCGVLFGYVFKRNSDGGTSTDDSTDLGIDSPEIKRLLNNPNLHKVFPGIDYTPLNTQYPDCLHNPPSQNNITRDVAVLSQLTNTIRLYGTDCNQTEMTLHALDRLKLNDTIKIWLGVWQDNNATTNSRQLQQMWNILDKYGDKPFKGLIIANEILFREQMDISTLGNLLATVRSNLTANQMSLPVATSDLGDKWTAELATQSDYVMSNIHPFFGGINARDAASWTYSFWENHNSPFFKSDLSKNIIAETGWPSQGGTDCGTTAITVCPDASVAGIDELNRFMEDWVCQALTNGTQYFWFEAFDEPWKISFDSGDQNWEDHWGLMDVNRNLKSGVKIPDCGGKTI